MNAETSKSRSKNATKQTRAQRRSSARTAQKLHNRKQQRRVPIGAIAGSLITVAALAAILAYALVRSEPQQSNQALTVPRDLNPAQTTLSAGTIAPNFILKDVNGKRYSLAAQRGHPVLLEFFAVWCPHCQAEAPTIARLTKAYSPHGVRVWSVLASPYGRNYEDSGGADLRPANKGGLQWFAKTFNVTHPQLVDPHFAVVNKYGLPGYPTLFVIDSHGRITYSTSGQVPYRTVSSALHKALTSGR